MSTQEPMDGDNGLPEEVLKVASAQVAHTAAKKVWEEAIEQEPFRDKDGVALNVEELTALYEEQGSFRKHAEVAVEWAKRLQIALRSGMPMHKLLMETDIPDMLFREAFEKVGAKNFQMTRAISEGFLIKNWEHGDVVQTLRNDITDARARHAQQWVNVVNTATHDPHKDEHSL